MNHESLEEGLIFLGIAGAFFILGFIFSKIKPKLGLSSVSEEKLGNGLYFIGAFFIILSLLKFLK